MRLTIDKAIEVLKEYYKRTEQNKWVEKPISRALYLTWRDFNAIEPKRSKEEKDGSFN